MHCPRCEEESILPEAEKLAVIEIQGPPAPKTRNCEVCGHEMNFWKVRCPACERSRKRTQTALQVMACIPVVILLAGLVLLARHIDKDVLTVRAKTMPDPVKSQIETRPVLPPTPHILIEQPRPHVPKSTNDLKIGNFALEKRRGSDLVLAVGDIENISDNTHDHVQAVLDVLDRSGVKIGEVSDFVMTLRPHQRWHFLARVVETNAVALKLAGLVEE